MASYLSDHRKYYGLLLRIDGSLRAVDIFGFKQGGEKILIQITQESNRHQILKKIYDLKAVAGDEMWELKLIFCGPANKIVPDPEWNRAVENVEYITLNPMP